MLGAARVRRAGERRTRPRRHAHGGEERLERVVAEIRVDGHGVGGGAARRRGGAATPGRRPRRSTRCRRAWRRRSRAGRRRARGRTRARAPRADRAERLEERDLRLHGDRLVGDRVDHAAAEALVGPRAAGGAGMQAGDDAGGSRSMRGSRPTHRGAAGRAPPPRRGGRRSSSREGYRPPQPDDPRRRRRDGRARRPPPRAGRRRGPAPAPPPTTRAARRLRWRERRRGARPARGRARRAARSASSRPSPARGRRRRATTRPAGAGERLHEPVVDVGGEHHPASRPTGAGGPHPRCGRARAPRADRAPPRPARSGDRR